MIDPYNLKGAKLTSPPPHQTSLLAVTCYRIMSPRHGACQRCHLPMALRAESCRHRLDCRSLFETGQASHGINMAVGACFLRTGKVLVTIVEGSYAELGRSVHGGQRADRRMIYFTRGQKTHKERAIPDKTLEYLQAPIRVLSLLVNRLYCLLICKYALRINRRSGTGSCAIRLR